MKHVLRLFSLLLALSLCLSVALCEGEEDAAAVAGDTVLFTLDGAAYTKDQVDAVLQDLAANDYLESNHDYDTVIEYMIHDAVIDQKIKEWGLDQYTQEELAAFEAEAQAEWNTLLDEYVSYYLTEDSDAARAETRKNAEALYTSYGYSAEMIRKNLISQDGYDRLRKRLTGGQEPQVTEDEIKAVFDEYVAQQQDLYENNVYMYELYKNYGQEPWYRPNGYRGIIHILIKADEALLTAYENAQNTYEEHKSDENADDLPAMKSAADAARQAVLDSEKAALDDIYARLAKGESFESLIAAYGEDEGMKDEQNLKNGYDVHVDSITWDPAFVAGAFQEKMQKPGDVSDPVVGANGIHILYYLRDIPGGAVEMTEDIRAEILEYLQNTKTNDLFAKALDGWVAEHDVVYNTEAIEAVKKAAPAAGAADAAGDGEEMTEEEWQQLLAMLGGDGEITEETDTEEQTAPAVGE